MSTNSDDLFNENVPDTKQDDKGTSSDDKYADLLKTIKNEEGHQKYDSVEKALEALVHSQDYIPRLKGELANKDKRVNELEELMKSNSSIEDLVKRLTEKKDEGQGNPPVAGGLDEQAVAKLLEDKLAQLETTKRVEANMSKFSQVIKEKFGEKASEEIRRVAQENDLSMDELKRLATQSPNAALKLFNVSGVKSPSPTTGGMNIPPINNTSTDPAKPTKSLLSGSGAGKDAVEYMRQIREHVLAEAQRGNLR